MKAVAIAIIATFLAVNAWGMDVTLVWDANSESDLAGYRLYYSTEHFKSSDPVVPKAGRTVVEIPLGSLDNPSLPEFSLEGIPNMGHYFALTAYDREGLESGFSNVVPVKIPPKQVVDMR
jgi:chitinase